MEMLLRPVKKGRTYAQNNLSHRWYDELGKHTGHGEGYERARCKLTLGIPILRASDEEFCELYDKYFKHLAYDVKLHLMEKLEIPVTSLMSTKQFADYLTAMEQDAANNLGLFLSQPGDIYKRAMKL
jgi:hypothetical protein